MAEPMELRIPGELKQDRGTITIDVELAVAFRRIAIAEGRSRRLSALFHDMMKSYLAAEHPDWTLVKERPKKRSKKR